MDRRARDIRAAIEGHGLRVIEVAQKGHARWVVEDAQGRRTVIYTAVSPGTQGYRFDVQRKIRRAIETLSHAPIN